MTTAHANCSHPKTAAARAKCRRARQAAATPAPAPTPTFQGPRNQQGFPLTTCGRCCGTGRYPSAAYQGVCLGCSGTGLKDYNRSSRRQRLAYEAHVIDAQTTPLEDIKVGDTVLVSVGLMGTTTRWEKVEQIGTIDYQGSSTIGAGEDAITTVYTQAINLKTKSSGLTAPINPDTGTSGTIRRWGGKVDPAPWLAKIKY